MKKLLALLSVMVLLGACTCNTCTHKKDFKGHKNGKHHRVSKCGGKCDPFKKIECDDMTMSRAPMTVAPVAAQKSPVAAQPVKAAPAKITAEDLTAVAAVKSSSDKTVRIVFKAPIEFETNSDKIKPESEEPIKKLAAVLKKYPGAHTTVEGYTDNMGDAAYNVDLSQRRAKTVADHLVNNGVNKDNVSSKGYGAANPIADNKTKEGRAKNRRVELDIVNK